MWIIIQFIVKVTKKQNKKSWRFIEWTILSETKNDSLGNQKWLFYSISLKTHFQCMRVSFTNDFEAVSEHDDLLGAVCSVRPEAE